MAYEHCQLLLHAWEPIPVTREHRRRFMCTTLMVFRCTRCGTGKVYQLDVNFNLMKSPTYFDRPKDYPKRPSVQELRKAMAGGRRQRG